MSRYEKTFCSTSGEKFRADVYSVLVAFGVACPARQHAIKKLLMPGQRGSKSEIQDLDEALVSVSRAIAMARAGLPEGDTLTGKAEKPPYIFTTEPEPEPKPKPKLVAWRKCVRITPGEINSRLFYVDWYPSGSIPEYWHPLVASLHPVETFKELPEGQEP